MNQKSRKRVGPTRKLRAVMAYLTEEQYAALKSRAAQALRSIGKQLIFEAEQKGGAK